VISHGNYRAMLDMTQQAQVLEAQQIAYLFLPLAHSFALLIQLGSFDIGGTIAYWERDPLKIVPNLSEVKPHYFPSVPRIFEKIYTTVTSDVEKAGGIKKRMFDWAVGVGTRYRAKERSGQKPDFLLQKQYDLADKLVLDSLTKKKREDKLSMSYLDVGKQSEP
jgi:long-chain acyl-CoA synthetase